MSEPLTFAEHNRILLDEVAEQRERIAALEEALSGYVRAVDAERAAWRSGVDAGGHAEDVGQKFDALRALLDRQNTATGKRHLCMGCQGPLTTDGWNRCAGCGRQEDECGYRNQVHVGGCLGRQF